MIIWDEFPNAHKELFEAAYALLHGFHGITFVGCGDFRQIAPVVTGGGRPETAYASITRSAVWSHFQLLHLTQSFRDRGDPIYAAFALEVGNGTIGELPDPPRPHSGERIVELPIRHFHEGELEEAVQFVYPALGDINQEFTPRSSRAILATTNEAVDDWNNYVQQLRPGETVELLSKDCLVETDDPDGKLAEMVPVQYLNTLCQFTVGAISTAAPTTAQARRRVHFDPQPGEKRKNDKQPKSTNLRN